MMSLEKHKSDILPLLVLLLGVVAVFSGIVGNGFVSWDDPNYLLDNPSVQSFTLSNLQDIFFSFRNGNYHPLPLFSYAIEHALFGLSPQGYHAVSLVWHLVNVCLVFVLLRSLQLNAWAAFAATLLYAVHPLRVEAVAWVTGRKDLMCTFFSLCTLLAYITPDRAGRTGNRWVVAVLFVLALLSKGTAIMLPPLLLVIDRLLGVRVDRRRVLRQWPLYVLALCFTLLAFMARASFQGVLDEGSYSLAAMLATGFYRLVFYYLIRTFVPVLNLFTPYPGVANFFDPFVLSATLICVVVLVVVLWKRWHVSKPVLGGWFFLVAIVPALCLPVVGYSADRFTYFPSIGLAFSLGWCFQELTRQKVVQAGALSVVVLSGIGLGWTTVARCMVWHDSVSLYGDSIALFEGKSGQGKNLARAYADRGKAYRDEGDMFAALLDFKQSLRYDPTVYQSWMYLGEMQVATGSLREAVSSFSQAINVASQEPAAWIGRAMALRRLGELDKALHDAEQALRLSPDDAFAYSARGLIWKEMGALANALADFDRVVKLAPQRFEGYYNRGVVLDRLGQKERAARDFAMVLNIDPYNRRAKAWLDSWRVANTQ